MTPLSSEVGFPTSSAFLYSPTNPRSQDRSPRVSDKKLEVKKDRTNVNSNSSGHENCFSNQLIHQMHCISSENVQMSFSSGKVLEPISHQFVYTPESSFQSNDLEDFNESCHNGRFVKHDELISKSKYRTIHRGYDNESGCEIAWSAYNLKSNAALDMRNMMLDELRKVQSVTNKYILKVIYFETRPYKKPERTERKCTAESIVQPEQVQEQLIMITELITTGSLRQYTKKIRNPRIKVVKKWCSAILEGLHQLHINGVVHGNLSCESIYVNSNNGEIKLGDLGIKSVIRENCFELDGERLMCDPKKFDVYWFGMCLLEMLICSEVPGRMGVKQLHKMLCTNRRPELFSKISDETLKDFLEKALEADSEKRPEVKDLQGHAFLQPSLQIDQENVKSVNSLAELILRRNTVRKKKDASTGDLQSSQSQLDTESVQLKLLELAHIRGRENLLDFTPPYAEAEDLSDNFTRSNTIPIQRSDVSRGVVYVLSQAQNLNAVIDEYLLSPQPLGISAQEGTGVKFEDIRPYRYSHESSSVNKNSSPKVKKQMSPRVSVIEAKEPFTLNKIGAKQEKILQNSSDLIGEQIRKMTEAAQAVLGFQLSEERQQGFQKMIEKWLKAQEPSEHTLTQKTQISYIKSCHHDSDESNFDFSTSEISKLANFDKDEVSGFDISVNHSLEQEQLPTTSELPVVANEDDEPADDNKGMIEQSYQMNQNPNNTTGEIHQEMLQQQQQSGPIGGKDIVNKQLLTNSITYKDHELQNLMNNFEEPMEKVVEVIEFDTQTSNQKEDEDQLVPKNMLDSLFPGYAQEYHEQELVNNVRVQEGNCSCEINAALDSEAMNASFHSFEGITNSELKDQVFTLDVSSIDFSEENCSFDGKKSEIEDGKQNNCAQQKRQARFQYLFGPKQGLFLEEDLSSIIFEQSQLNTGTGTNIDQTCGVGGVSIFPALGRTVMMTPSNINLRSMIRRSTLEKTADDLTFIAGLPSSLVYEVPFQTEELLSATLGVIEPSSLAVEETPKVLTLKSEIEVIGFTDDIFTAQRSLKRRKSTLDEVRMAEAIENSSISDGIPESSLGLHPLQSLMDDNNREVQLYGTPYLMSRKTSLKERCDSVSILSSPSMAQVQATDSDHKIELKGALFKISPLPIDRQQSFNSVKTGDFSRQNLHTALQQQFPSDPLYSKTATKKQSEQALFTFSSQHFETFKQSNQVLDSSPIYEPNVCETPKTQDFGFILQAEKFSVFTQDNQHGTAPDFAKEKSRSPGSRISLLTSNNDLSFDRADSFNVKMSAETHSFDGQEGSSEHEIYMDVQSTDSPTPPFLSRIQFDNKSDHMIDDFIMYRSSPSLLSKFDATMGSEVLKRHFKQMLTKDICLLKEAFQLICPKDEVVSDPETRTHFDKHTSKLVARFQRKHNCTQNGEVNKDLWSQIMSLAKKLQSKRILSQKDEAVSPQTVPNYASTHRAHFEKTGRRQSVQCFLKAAQNSPSLDHPTTQNKKIFKLSIQATPMFEAELDQCQSAKPNLDHKTLAQKQSNTSFEEQKYDEQSPKRQSSNTLSFSNSEAFSLIQSEQRNNEQDASNFSTPVFSQNENNDSQEFSQYQLFQQLVKEGRQSFQKCNSLRKLPSDFGKPILSKPLKSGTPKNKLSQFNKNHSRNQ